MIRTTLSIALLLAACAHIEPVPGWPKLATAVVRIPDGEIYSRCIGAWPVWQRVLFMPLPLGCAEWNLAARTCIVWAGETSSDGTVEHELAHCAGWDHGTGMREALLRWQSTR